jgi:hypothetical protein
MRIAVVRLDRKGPVETVERGRGPAHSQQHRTPVAERLGMQGSDRQCPIITFQGLAAALEFQERAAPVEAGVQMGRRSRERRIVAGNGLLPSMQATQRIAAMVVGIHRVGRNRQRPVKAVDGACMMPELMQRNAAVLPGRRMLRRRLGGGHIESDSLVAAHDRRFELAGRQMRSTADEVEADVLRIGSQRPVDQLHRPSGLSGLDEHAGEQPHGPKIARLGLEHGLIACPGIGQPPLAMQRDGLLQQEVGSGGAWVLHGKRRPSVQTSRGARLIGAVGAAKASTVVQSPAQKNCPLPVL